MSDQVQDILKNLIKEFIPRKLHRFLIFKKRPRLIIWLILSFLLFCGNFASNTISFIIMAILYFIIINIALSDFIEKLMRIIEDCRRVATNTEKERLLLLFNEVYEETQKASNHISKDIELYIVDEMSINAFALGRNTIAITRGLMQTMNDNELKGILAHEFGHMANGDTQVNMLIMIGTTIYLWGFLVIRVIFKRLEAMSSDATGSIMTFIRKLIEISMQCLLFIAAAIIGSNGRKKEYSADLFACRLGYSQELLSALYKLYDMQVSDKQNLIEQIKVTHPKIAYRIEQLEKQID